MANAPSSSSSVATATLSDAMDQGAERLVKSSERVRDLGEVFTPAATVRAMLDLVPDEIWAVHPSASFFEPSCGDGNFLVAILERKLERVAAMARAGSLPAGTEPNAVMFHALEALASIYAVDISADNVTGGTPGHEVGARERLLKFLMQWCASAAERRLDSRSLVFRSAAWIVDHNIVIGNMLPSAVAGCETGSLLIPLVEYQFSPATETVLLRATTMGDVLDVSRAASSAELSLFGPPMSEMLWEGDVTRIWQAERLETPALRGPARNGVKRSHQ